MKKKQFLELRNINLIETTSRMNKMSPHLRSLGTIQFHFQRDLLLCSEVLANCGDEMCCWLDLDRNRPFVHRPLGAVIEDHAQGFLFSIEVGQH